MGSLHSRCPSRGLSAGHSAYIVVALLAMLLSVGCSDIKPLMNQRCGTDQKIQLSLTFKQVGVAVYQAVVMNERIELQLDPNVPPQKQIKFWTGVLLNSAVDIARLNMSTQALRVLESLRRCSTCSIGGQGCTPTISFDYKRFLLDEVPELSWQFVPGKLANVINITVGVAKICGICPMATPIPGESMGTISLSNSDDLSSGSGAQALYNTALFSSGANVLRIRRAGETEFSRLVPAGDADGNGLVNADDIQAILSNTNVACPLAVSRLIGVKQTTHEILLQMLYMVRTGQFVPCSEQDATRIGRLTERILANSLMETHTPTPGAQAVNTAVPASAVR